MTLVQGARVSRAATAADVNLLQYDRARRHVSPQCCSPAFPASSDQRMRAPPTSSWCCQTQRRRAGEYFSSTSQRSHLNPSDLASGEHALRARSYGVGTSAVGRRLRFAAARTTLPSWIEQLDPSLNYGGPPSLHYLGTPDLFWTPETAPCL
jgi:hypothetical protein